MDTQVSDGVIRILIADGYLIDREGLKSILAGVRHVEVVGEAAFAQQAVSLAGELRPNVVLMGLVWYGDETAGIEATHQITTNNGSKVLVVTSYPQFIREAREAGATAAIGKGFSKEDLVNLIRQVYRTEKFVAVLDDAKTFGLPEELTPREQEVLKLLVQGNNVRQIGQLLSIAPSTVKNHVQSIYGKMHVQNRAEVVHKAMTLGLAS